MTEELEKEAGEYIKWHPTEGIKDFVIYKVRVGENAFAYVVEHKNELYCSDWIKICEGTEQECYRVVGYLDSAEPREKHIAELKKQLDLKEKALSKAKKETKRITDRVNKDKRRLIRRKAELEAQIEKMKCCEICANSKDWRNRGLCVECEKSKTHINFELRR